MHEDCKDMVGLSCLTRQGCAPYDAITAMYEKITVLMTACSMTVFNVHTYLVSTVGVEASNKIPSPKSRTKAF